MCTKDYVISIAVGLIVKFGNYNIATKLETSPFLTFIKYYT